MNKTRAIIQNLHFSVTLLPLVISRPVSSKPIAYLFGHSGYSSVPTDARALKNRNPDEAREVFSHGFPCPNIRSCTRMIVGYARNGKLEQALHLFERMLVRDVISWNVMINACLYCGELELAMELFDEMPERTVVSWTTMINGFFKFGKVDMAERFFELLPTRDLAAYNAMLHGYFSNCRVEDAMKFFEGMPSRDVISWTSVIGGLDQHGMSGDALLVFKKMANYGISPTSSTLACVLSACGKASTVFLGLQTHGLALKLGFWFDEFICSALITFYSVSKQMDRAIEVVSDMELNKNVILWTAVLTGFSSNDKHQDALKVFGNMLRAGALPNQSSFSSVLNSCCGLEALDRGREIHAPAIKLNLGEDLFVCNSLIVMYSKCGSMNDSLSLFSRTCKKNLVTWNAAISGCAQHGRGIEALALFTQMIRSCVRPDEFTVTGLLSACSHSGLLQKGKQLFKYFSRRNAFVELKHEHYSSMVDLLGRCGKLAEAEELIKSMPMEPNSIVWLALLSAGRKHSNFDVSERAMSRILKVDPHSSAAYVLMSNLYASTDQWSEVSRLRVLMKRMGIVKQAGTSWVIVKGQRHVFRSGDKSHSLSVNIYRKLDWLNGKLKELGYVSDRRFALHDVEDEQKEESLSYHSERLAIAFALVSTTECSPIIIMKNLRVCGDCHTVIKLIGQIVRRGIIVRDSTRFHHFNDGACSCGDYW